MFKVKFKKADVFMLSVISGVIFVLFYFQATIYNIPLVDYVMNWDKMVAIYGYILISAMLGIVITTALRILKGITVRLFRVNVRHRCIK